MAYFFESSLQYKEKKEATSLLSAWLYIVKNFCSFCPVIMAVTSYF